MDVEVEGGLLGYREGREMSGSAKRVKSTDCRAIQMGKQARLSHLMREVDSMNRRG